MKKSPKLLALGLLPAAALGQCAPSSCTPAPETPIEAPIEAPAPEPLPATEPAPAPPAPPTVSQQNAVRKAASYLRYSSFSRTGLIKQLEFEGFSNADAIYGTDAQGADWNEQAAKKAASYLRYSAFSRSGLIRQLLYEGFTQEQAEYGVSTTGL